MSSQSRTRSHDGIVNSLRLKLSPGRRRYETNLEAYDLYLRGRHIMASFPTRGRPIAKPAVDYFEQAIAKDPNYAIAYAGMADAFLAIERNMGAASPLGRTGLTRARAAAERAVELDPMLSEAQSAMASIRAREYAWQDAERGFRRAIELNPNNALAHLELGAAVLVEQGRFEEGLGEVRRAVALDPLSPYVNTEFGRALLLAGRYAEAVDQLRKAIALDPSRNRPYNLMGRALYLQGKTAEALTVFDESIKRGATRWRSGLAGLCRSACRTPRKGCRSPRRATRYRRGQPGGWPRPMRASAMKSTRSSISRNRSQNTKRVLRRFSRRRSWHRCARTPRFAALRKKLNLAP